MKKILLFLAAFILLADSAVADVAWVEKAEQSPPALQALAMKIGGRYVAGKGAYRFQWPGTYFEARFKGTDAYFHMLSDGSNFRLVVDGGAPIRLGNPEPGLYYIGGLGRGEHTVRLEWTGEWQQAPLAFGGFMATDAKDALPPPPARPRAIEFIGDSHTVGYGNTSARRDCTDDEVADRTDSSRAFGPLVARHYDADYRLNAISGRGVVRNYSGGAGDTLPEAYPYGLLDGHTPAAQAPWQPQVIVIDLGTNDFSTPLRAGEKWADRAALHADFEATYAAFVQKLHAAHPEAFLILMAPDGANGEIKGEGEKVFRRLRADGLKRLAWLPLPPLEFTACNWHPSLADDRLIADSLIQLIDTVPVWQDR